MSNISHRVASSFIGSIYSTTLWCQGQINHLEEEICPMVPFVESRFQLPMVRRLARQKKPMVFPHPKHFYKTYSSVELVLGECSACWVNTCFTSLAGIFVHYLHKNTYIYILECSPPRMPVTNSTITSIYHVDNIYIYYICNTCMSIFFDKGIPYQPSCSTGFLGR